MVLSLVLWSIVVHGWEGRDRLNAGSLLLVLHRRHGWEGMVLHTSTVHGPRGGEVVSPDRWSSSSILRRPWSTGGGRGFSSSLVLLSPSSSTGACLVWSRGGLLLRRRPRSASSLLVCFRSSTKPRPRPGMGREGRILHCHVCLFSVSQHLDTCCARSPAERGISFHQ